MIKGFSNRVIYIEVSDSNKSAQIIIKIMTPVVHFGPQSRTLSSSVSQKIC